MAFKRPLLLLCTNFLHILLHIAAAVPQQPGQQAPAKQEADLAATPNSLTSAGFANTVYGAAAGPLLGLDHSVQRSIEANPPTSFSPALRAFYPYPTLPGQSALTSQETHITLPSPTQSAESAVSLPKPSIREGPPSWTGQEASFPTGAPVSGPSRGKGLPRNEPLYSQGGLTQDVALLEQSQSGDSALDSFLRESLQPQVVPPADEDSSVAGSSLAASPSASSRAARRTTASIVAAGDTGSAGPDVLVGSTGGTSPRTVASQPTVRSADVTKQSEATVLAAAPGGGALPPGTALGVNVTGLAGTLRSGVTTHSWTDVTRLTHMAFSRNTDKHRRDEDGQIPPTKVPGEAGGVGPSKTPGKLPGSHLPDQAGGKLSPDVLAQADGGTAHPWKSIFPVNAPAVQWLGQLAQSEVYSLVLQDFKTDTLADGTIMGSGNLTYATRNGTLLQINALSAPLVPQGVLNYTEFYLRMNIAAVASTVRPSLPKPLPASPPSFP